MGYYLGDYYRGDPGIGSSLMKLGVGLAKFTPLGRVVSAAATGIGLIGAARSFTGGAGVPALPGQPGLRIPGTGVSVHPGSFLPGGKPFITRQGAQCGVPGHHLNKAKVYARAAAAEGSYCVRNRSMNPANPRALRRAIRREHAFVALARRVLKGSGLQIKRKGMGRAKAKGARGRCRKCR